MLTNAVRAGTGTSARLDNMTAAGKTGTTNDNKDRWFAGYTPYYTAVVWTGYDRPEYMSVGSKNPAAVLWQRVMTRINESLELENAGFPDYAETVSRSICLDCGKLAGANCGLDPRGSRAASYTFVRGDEPKESCTCHVAVEVCRDCPVLNAEGQPTGFYHLTTEYCPEESRMSIALVYYVRELAAETVVVEDTQYMLSHFEATAQPCNVHDWYSQIFPGDWPPGTDDPSQSGNVWPWPWQSEDPAQTDDPFAWPSDYNPFESLEPAPSVSLPAIETPPPEDTGGYWDYPWELG